jgi:pimeloyl-ACP methyl ester carboxylesterase
MTERLVHVNGVDLCVETFGDRGDPAILLIMGAAASMLWWEAELCEQVAANGRYVIRYDNRDSGKSTYYPPGQPDYSFTDLTGDALGILDALAIDRAHFVCRSWSGGIGLIAGVDHPDRVASLTFTCSSTGEPNLPPPSPGIGGIAEPDPIDRSAVVDYVVASAMAYSGGSPYFDEAATRDLVERDVDRARSIASTLTNHYAIDFDGPVGGGFGDIQAPTLVVHGDHDPLLPLAHGQALRAAIPGAELLVLEGAGHDVPKPLWDVFVPALVRHTEGERR